MERIELIAEQVAAAAERVCQFAAGTIEVLDRAEAEGKLTSEARLGTLIQTVLRGIDRIAQLPDDRDLTQAESDILVASLVQVSSGALAVIVESGLDPSAVPMIVAGFDTRRPT